MQYRTLGNSNLAISELGFGGIPILRLPTDEAIRVLRHAYEQGITFYDTANAYQDSEEKIGKAFAGMRDKVVIATKSMKRDATGTTEHINNSLTMMQTDYIDLFQFHQVAQDSAWEQITGPGGALEAVLKAQQAGKVRHIGVTSHSLPMAIKLIQTKLFVTVQFPFNFIENAPSSELHPLAEQLGLGIIGMKPFAGGVIDDAALAFAFLRQYPAVIPIPGFDSVESVDQIVGFYQKPNHLTESDLAKMELYRQELGRQFCRRCEYCQPCPHGVMITPAMGYKVLAGRMSAKTAVNFNRQAMESIDKCIQCGVCLPRCPYNLPIPEILHKYYDLYQEHCKEFGQE
ncbi:aldo/keto reductase [Anaerosporomusa subterranea]|uniref:Aldo/keto reductase n=1 Tax=Anaerosporomusa subterranea TaxID=1794912 RepID=A0A154BWN2_ANASB|nr:aldo/keto reductase [Anaerosporomusa subterranea]KYZ78200.1 aldo/keto reductase [Anaerosporomusa subterranea]